MTEAGAGTALVAIPAIPALFTYGAYRRGLRPTLERNIAQAAYNHRVCQRNNDCQTHESSGGSPICKKAPSTQNTKRAAACYF